MPVKIAVSSYSFARLLRRGELTLPAAIAKAKELGYDGIEFAGHLEAPEGVAPSAYAARLREECAKHGLEVAAYLVGADFLGAGAEVEAERLRGEVDLAVALGAPLLRHDVAYGWPRPGPGERARTFAEALPILAQGCRAVTEYAAGRGVRTMVENHGYFCQDSARVEALCLAVDHPNFGLLFDMGNFMCADEQPLAAARVAPLAFHVHAKDFLWHSGREECPGAGWFPTRGGDWLRGTVIGHGVVPVAAIVRKLLRDGYPGWLTVEFEGAEEVIPALEAGLAYLRRLTA